MLCFLLSACCTARVIDTIANLSKAILDQLSSYLGLPVIPLARSKINATNNNTIDSAKQGEQMRKANRNA